MGTILAQLKKVQSLNLRKEVPELIRSTSGTLISLNQKQLFNEGVNTQGKIIGRYSLGSEILSGGKKKQGDPFTFKDTGAFFAGFNITVDTDRIIFASSDSKSEELEYNYGSDIFGLTDQSKAQYRVIFIQRLNAYIDKKLK